MSDITLPRLLGTNGVYGVGKDYVLKKLGYKILGFADPLYEIAAVVTGTTVEKLDKGAPGIREMLQTIGQWGRGMVNDKYPLTIERHLFENQLWGNNTTAYLRLREKLADRYAVDRRTWGTSDCWSQSLRIRMRAALAGNKDAKVASSNVRFLNESAMIQALGGQVWFVDAPQAEIKGRQLQASARTLNDPSEALAKAIRKALVDGSSVLVEGKEVPVTSIVTGVIWNSPAASPKVVVPVYRMEPEPVVATPEPNES